METFSSLRSSRDLAIFHVKPPKLNEKYKLLATRAPERRAFVKMNLGENFRFDTHNIVFPRLKISLSTEVNCQITRSFHSQTVCADRLPRGNVPRGNAPRGTAFQSEKQEKRTRTSAAPDEGPSE